MGKLYDLAVKVGEYQDQQGNTKSRYENVGAVIEKNDGGQFMLIKRTFNPAGVPLEDPARDMIIVSMFEPKQKDGGGRPASSGGGGGGGGKQQSQQSNSSGGGGGGGFSDFEDDIPF